MNISTDLIAQYWPVNDVHIGKIFQQYETRKIFGIHTSQGNYVIKAFQDGMALGLGAISLERIEQCLSVFAYLEQRQFPHIPRLLKTRSEQAHLYLDGHIFYIMEWIEGSAPVQSEETYSDLGHIAGKLKRL